MVETFFDGCEEGFVNEVIIQMYTRLYNPGTTMLSAGSRVTEVCFIFKGQVGIFPLTKEKDGK